MSVRTSVFASDLALRSNGGKRRTVGGWLHTVAYAVWLGGLIAIGAFVAPHVAEIIQTNPQLASNKPLQNAILINVIGNSFRTFNTACYVCGGCMIFGDLLQSAVSAPGYRRFTLARTFFTVLLLATAAFLGCIIFPQMDAARNAGNMTYFDILHKRYVLISELQLIPLLIIPFLTSRRDQSIDSRF